MGSGGRVGERGRPVRVGDKRYRRRLLALLFGRGRGRGLRREGQSTRRRCADRVRSRGRARDSKSFHRNRPHFDLSGGLRP